MAVYHTVFVHHTQLSNNQHFPPFLDHDTIARPTWKWKGAGEEPILSTSVRTSTIRCTRTINFTGISNDARLLFLSGSLSQVRAHAQVARWNDAWKESSRTVGQFPPLQVGHPSSTIFTSLSYNVENPSPDLLLFRLVDGLIDSGWMADIRISSNPPGIQPWRDGTVDVSETKKEAGTLADEKWRTQKRENQERPTEDMKNWEDR